MIYRSDPLLAAAERRVRDASARLAAQTCTHPIRALRFDGLYVMDPVLAQVTCLLERGGCGNSITLPVRHDVAQDALNDVAKPFHDPTVPRTAPEIPTTEASSA